MHWLVLSVCLSSNPMDCHQASGGVPESTVRDSVAHVEDTNVEDLMSQLNALNS